MNAWLIFWMALLVLLVGFSAGVIAVLWLMESAVSPAKPTHKTTQLTRTPDGHH